MKIAAPEVFDVVVIGSGAAGGWAAKKFTEAGLRVAVIEAGRKLEPQRDFTDHKSPHELPLRGRSLPRTVRERKPVQSQSYAFSEQTSQFFVDDKDNPYSTAKDRPFVWIRGRQVGGKTITWGRIALRFGEQDFQAASRDGVGIDWPLTYRELEPYYDEVERFIGVSGMKEGLPQLPDGQFLPAMQLSCVEQMLKAGIKRQFGRTLTIGRSAVLTQNHQGRAQCHSCGPCERGCITRSYFSSPASTLAAADATGRMTLLPNLMVSHLTEDGQGRVRSAWCVDATTGKQREIRGRVFSVCASTLESTRILLNSTSARFPNGLGNTSGVLGKYLMDHVVAFAGGGRVPSMSNKADARGYRPTTFYIARFQNLGASKADHLRGFAFQGQSRDTGLWGHAFALPGFGVELKQAVKVPRPEWYVWMLGFGECLPYATNGCRLNPALKDRWGIPTLTLDVTYRENERAMAKAMGTAACEMLDLVGVKGIAEPGLGAPGAAVHEVGTARMGVDPKTSFLNRWNQSHELKNLFVMDGAAFPSSPCQNPTLTIMALAARASDYAVSELKKLNL